MQVDFTTGGAESESHLHLAPHAHFNHQGTSANPAFTPFRHPAAAPIDPGLDQTQGTARNGHAQLAVHPSASPHLLQADHASLNTSHMAHNYYGDISRASQTPSTPSNASPRFSALSPNQQKQIGPAYVPNDRSAPSRNVSDETIDGAYAAFILYCNPSFPTSTDTSELTKAFRTPPKSDGKSFSTWSLFELIRKLDLKEIKTWTQLALDLGVEPPDMDKGQSTQKVQQYSVRLKRWMRAMHIDAFFEFLLGKQHLYYIHIPPPHNPFPPDGRDAVPLEEDLAIRALDPKYRPKRGRRKTEDPDEDLDPPDHATPPRKRPQLDTSIPFGNLIGQPQSAYPDSAHPDDVDRFLSAHDPWTAASAITPASAMTTASAPSRLNPQSRNLTPYTATPMSAGQQLRWRLNTQDNPSTPHPMSATTPQTAHPDFPFNEPQSAITPSSAKSRSRRRHGPAVSSAWPSNSTSASGKLRGRPPSNRSVRDGPFVTFPANPNTKEGPTIEMNRNNNGCLTPIVERAQSDPPEHHFRFPPATPASAVSTQSLQEQSVTNPQGRPTRLQVQVPQHVGGPVRLVTPTLLVNGEQDPTPSTGFPPSALSGICRRSSGNYFDDDDDDAHDTRSMFPPSSTQSSRTSQDIRHAQHSSAHHSRSNHATADHSISSLTHETLNRALAADLLRAPLAGRRKRLRGTEAKHLASALLQNLYSSHTPSSASARSMTDTALRFSIASSLGLCTAVGLGAGGPTGGVKSVVVQRFRVGRDGYDSPLDEADDDETLSTPRDGVKIKETWDVFFQVSFGALSGEWSIKSLEVAAEGAEGEREGGRAGEGGAMDVDAGAEDWKAKFEEAQKKLGEVRSEVGRLRDKVLDAVL